MKNKINITAILRGVIIFSLLFLLFACGKVDGGMSDGMECEGDDCTPEDGALEAQYNTCWQADVVGLIYKSIGTLVMRMYGQLTNGAMALMMVAFAIWMSFQILKHVSSFTEESPGEIWTEIIKKFFICIVCGILAGSTEGALFVLNSIIFPIYNAFLELGGAILGTTSRDGYFTSLLGNAPFQVEEKACVVTEAVRKATLDGFPSSPRLMMECLTCTVNEKMNFGIKLAWISMKQGGIMAFVCGLIMMLSFLLVKLGFILYLIDAVFRFAMMVMLLPLLIMAYAFKVTKKCVKIGFLTILNSAAFMMMIALVLMMIFAATAQILTENQQAFEDPKVLNDINVALLLFLLISFLAIKSISIAKDICDKLVGGGGGANFQKKFGAFLAFVGRQAFVGIGGKVLRAARDRSKFLQKMHNGKIAAQNKINHWAGRDKLK